MQVNVGEGGSANNLAFALEYKQRINIIIIQKP